MTSKHTALLPFVTFAASARKLFRQLQQKQLAQPIVPTAQKVVSTTEPRTTIYVAETGTKPSLLSRLTGTVLSECGRKPENFHDLMDMLSAYSKDRSFVFDLGEFLKSNGWIETRFIASRMYVKITACGLAHIHTQPATTTGE